MTAVLEYQAFSDLLEDLHVPDLNIPLYANVFGVHDDGQSSINFSQFVAALALFDGSNTSTADIKSDRIQAIFKFFDSNGDGQLNPANMTTLSSLLDVVPAGVGPEHVQRARAVLSSHETFPKADFVACLEAEADPVYSVLFSIVQIPALSLEDFGVGARPPYLLPSLLSHPLVQSARYGKHQLRVLWGKFCANAKASPDRLQLEEFTQYLMRDLHFPDGYGTPYFRAFNKSSSGHLSFEEFVLGLCAMRSVPNTQERLSYVFQCYANPDTSTIGFSEFSKMISHILRNHTDSVRDDPAATLTEATKLWRLDILTGALTEAAFIDACSREASATGIPGAGFLFRLLNGWEPVPMDNACSLLQQQSSIEELRVKLRTHVNNDVEKQVSLTHGAESTKKLVGVSFSLEHQPFVSGVSPSQTTPLFAENYCVTPAFEPCNAFLMNVLSDDFVLPDPSRPFELISAANFKILTILARQAAAKDAMCVSVKAPARLFGDIHGQLPELLRLFHAYGVPHHRLGDVHLVSYVFIGDFVDRGQYNLEVIALLMAIKVMYPDRVFLIRGNHEDRSINNVYGFQEECLRRFGRQEGREIWEHVNEVFDWLPVSAIVEKKIFCVHGGIGGTLSTIDEILAIPRPCPAPWDCAQQEILKDLLWSDPTNSDRTLGVHARHPDFQVRVTAFGPDRVLQFLQRNGLQLIVRAHECVDDGYEFFAAERLITLFSAADYEGGRYHNDGACLEISRDLCVCFRVIKSVVNRVHF